MGIRTEFADEQMVQGPVSEFVAYDKPGLAMTFVDQPGVLTKHDLVKFNDDLYAEMAKGHVPFERLARMRFEIRHTGDERSFTYKLIFPPMMAFEVTLTDKASLKTGIQDIVNVLLLTEAAWRNS